MPLFSYFLQKLRSFKNTSVSHGFKQNPNTVWSHPISHPSNESPSACKTHSEMILKPLCRQKRLYRMKSQTHQFQSVQSDVKYRMMSTKLSKQKRMNTFYKKKLVDLNRKNSN
ncbi:Ovule protein [Caenorhabditis elegans]|uniref:Ovule protein n=1 Tax=Caenorhabditis elegans TaxID=6239 RepID=Q56VZ1_CAEEL|nr:Ovule protein [Caenorhabditis elegans]CAI79263.1 Ovule protein [Caenorhabditis elegans]|eukprot:NP_001024613.1 Uncharacterized protein CELE_F28H6.8 [Caenorhabditis elegans]